MSSKRKTWREKLADNKGLPKVQKITGRMLSRWGKGTVALPSPLEVDALMRRVPPGKLTTINEIRAAVAARHKATIGCPMVTGIFSWIAANAAAEAAAEGEKHTTPFWRTLKSGGKLNAKFPGGIPALKKRLAEEGHRVIKKGESYYVAEFESCLFKP